jgi:hypothetical protein
MTLPYRFDTTSVWHTILKGAFALNALLVFGIALKLFTGDWPTALGLVGVEAMVLGVTRLFVRFQSGSIGTVYRIASRSSRTRSLAFRFTDRAGPTRANGSPPCA